MWAGQARRPWPAWYRLYRVERAQGHNWVRAKRVLGRALAWRTLCLLPVLHHSRPNCLASAGCNSPLPGPPRRWLLSLLRALGVLGVHVRALHAQRQLVGGAVGRLAQIVLQDVLVCGDEVPNSSLQVTRQPG